jgi:hypothetical protein
VREIARRFSRQASTPTARQSERARAACSTKRPSPVPRSTRTSACARASDAMWSAPMSTERFPCTDSISLLPFVGRMRYAPCNRHVPASRQQAAEQEEGMGGARDRHEPTARRDARHPPSRASGVGRSLTQMQSRRKRLRGIGYPRPWVWRRPGERAREWLWHQPRSPDHR